MIGSCSGHWQRCAASWALELELEPSRETLCVEDVVARREHVIAARGTALLEQARRMGAIFRHAHIGATPNNIDTAHADHTLETATLGLRDQRRRHIAVIVVSRRKQLFGHKEARAVDVLEKEHRGLGTDVSAQRKRKEILWLDANEV